MDIILHSCHTTNSSCLTQQKNHKLFTLVSARALHISIFNKAAPYSTKQLHIKQNSSIFNKAAPYSTKQQQQHNNLEFCITPIYRFQILFGIHIQTALTQEKSFQNQTISITLHLTKTLFSIPPTSKQQSTGTLFVVGKGVEITTLRNKVNILDGLHL